MSRTRLYLSVALTVFSLAGAGCNKTARIPIPPTAIPQKSKPQAAKPAKSIPRTAPPPPAAAPRPPAPQLGEVLSADARKEHSLATRDSLQRTRRSLDALQGRALDSREAEVLDRIHGFMRQAATALETDLVFARNLAERAEVLARDLLKRAR